jgi:hypothetical protein
MKIIAAVARKKPVGYKVTSEQQPVVIFFRVFEMRRMYFPVVSTDATIFFNSKKSVLYDYIKVRSFKIWWWYKKYAVIKD